MIIVTGTPRSGTSLMMQTLNILGIPITGDDFSNINVFGGNYKGYWELPEKEIHEGIQDNKYEGKVVKLFANGLLHTKEVLINKLIVCERPLHESVNSFYKLMRISPIKMEATRENAELVVNINKELIDAYLTVCTKPVFKVYFKEMLTNTKTVVKNLCEFLEIDCDDEKMNLVYENIMRGE